jgi:hypothetical protein
LRLTEEGARRLYAAARENEAERSELIRAFEELSASFGLATRLRR